MGKKKGKSKGSTNKKDVMEAAEVAVMPIFRSWLIVVLEDEEALRTQLSELLAEASADVRLHLCDRVAAFVSTLVSVNCTVFGP